MSLFVSRVLCCPCWGTSHFSTFASDHENGKYTHDCPFACRIVAEHSLMSGVMYSLAGIMDRKADCVQSMACLFTIHAAV